MNEKKNVWFRGLVMGICLVLILAMVPVPASASSPEAVDTVELGGLSVPFAGQYAQPVALHTLTAGSTMYTVEGSDTDACSQWKDAGGTVIDNQRYAFEAGKTYQLTVTFRVRNGNLYQFTDDTAVKLQGLNPKDYSVRIESQTVWTLTATFRFQLPGSPTYPEITEIYLKDAVPPEMGNRPDGSVNMLYGNFTVGSTFWTGALSNGTFQAGESYAFHVKLFASAGYSFASREQLTATLDGKQPTSVLYAQSGALQVLELVFEYVSASKKEIGTVWVEQGIRFPEAGMAAMAPEKRDIEISANAQYALADISSGWKRESGTALPSSERFRYGKAYSLTLTFTLKEAQSYLFTEEPVLVIKNLSNRNYRVVVLSRTASRVQFQVFFTADFPAAAGVTADNPVNCYCYEDLRGAMLSTAIRYVRLRDVDRTTGGVLPAPVKGDSLHYPVLSIGTKYLELAGQATFAYDGWKHTSGYCLPAGLIYNTGTLTVTGNGKLSYLSPAVDSYNATIVNRGELIIESGIVEGYDDILSQKINGNIQKNIYFGRAIYQAYSNAKLTVNGGTLMTQRYLSEAQGQSAVYIDGGSAVINGGTFTYGVIYGVKEGDCVGLFIGGGKTTVYGGSFKNMKFSQNVALSNYISTESRILVDGSRISNTLSCKGLFGQVEVLCSVSKLELHINAPCAGKNPSDTVYVTAGDAHGVSVSWYDRTAGSAMTTEDSFRAQHIYQVTIRVAADDSREFMTNSSGAPTTPTTVNFSSVTPKAVSGLSAKEVMEVVYVFGACPAVVEHLNITVLPPYPGRTPTQTAKMEDTTYGLYPVDPISWYDVTLERGVREGESFVKGHHYRAGIWIKAAQGYEFAVDEKLEPAITANVNGTAAPVLRAYEQSADEVVEVLFDFGVCGETVIDYVNVLQLDAPQPGAKPDMTACVQEPDKYELRQIWWDGPDGTMSESDTFRPGQTYTVTLYVAPLRVGGYAMYPLADDLQGYINSAQLDSGSITILSDRVYLKAQWICPATSADPGLIGDVTGDGKVNMGDVSRLFAHVRGKNTLTDAGALARGDVTGDGKLNMGDVSRLFAHARGKNKLF